MTIHIKTRGNNGLCERMKRGRGNATAISDSNDILKMNAKRSAKNRTMKELFMTPNKYASLVIRYKEESLYLDAMFMSQHSGLVRDFIHQKEGRLALDDNGGASVDSGVFIENLCFQDDDDDGSPKSKDEPPHAAKMRIPDEIRTVSWAAIVEVVLLCYNPLYGSPYGLSLDSCPFETDDSKSAEGEAAVDESESAEIESAAGEAVESEKAEGKPAVVETYSLLKAAHFLQAHRVSKLIEIGLIRILDKYLKEENLPLNAHCDKDLMLFFVLAHEFHLTEAWSTLIRIIKKKEGSADFLKWMIISPKYGSRISKDAQVEMLLAFIEP